ncbi:MAG: trimethylamine methyltransferase family protein [Chloroflexota bacterium]|nr:MAG: trimethylamine methyltransferase family protein [Chloroflexota bacterium]
MSGETPRLNPINSRFRLQILEKKQLQDFQSATLEILEEVGIHCPSEKVRKIYQAHGAIVDPVTMVVRFPPQVILEAMAAAPRFYTMAARKPEFDLVLDGKNFYCATDGCGTETIDFETRQRRESTKDDVAKMAIVSDYLDSIGFYWPIVSAQDFPATAPLQELDASFRNTIKHVQTETVMDEKMARYAVEMARVIAGDDLEMRARPPLSSLICTIAPLAQDAGGMEAALVFAEAGLPVGFMSMANVGSTGPATISGTLVAADAEIVAAMVLVQMAFPGAPTYHSMMPGIMHPRTGAYLGTAPEGELPYVVGVELAHKWGVPTLAGIFGTDAMQPGWESAAEAVGPLMLCAMCGAETGSGLGLLESCTVLYPEAVVLDTEIYHRVRIDLAGIDTSPGAFALEVIKNVGPRGHYLGQRHTREHLRKIHFSELTAVPAENGGFRDPLEVAQEKLDWILENHHPDPLDNNKQAEISKILSAAQREFS